MKAYCPNCGTQNEGMPGGRVTCSACTASFEVPREEGFTPPAPPPQPQVFQPPPPQAPTPTYQPPPIMPQGYVGPPPQGFNSGLATGGGETNPLAIVSLVLGILCCFPFSIGAVITGVIAQQQIAASNGRQGGQGLAIAGIALGSLAIVLNILGFLMRLVH
ncbi:MAG: DUF4190 domain-containing protein [Myxococcaceae bacterium]